LSARKTPELPALLSTLQLIQLVAGDEMMREAIPLVRAQLKLTPEKLAIMLRRIVNPDGFTEKGDEATLRGIKEETLRGYKKDGFFPEYLGGVSPQVMPRH
jgi:hypothetical protein